LGKAFTLKEGQVSSPFKTQFGYHIMQLVSRAGDDALVRHILKIPKVTVFETDDALKKLDSVRANLIAEKIAFGSAVSKYSDDTNGKFTGGMRQGQDGSTFLTIDQLDKDIIPILDKLLSGEFSQPMLFDGEGGKKGVRLIYLKSRSQPHRESLKEDYSKIADKALEEKKEDILEKWFSEKLSTYYIKIDPDYTDCDVMERWVKAAKAHGDM
jgi:peptidyl-prolyl cis-trans isomerase SurA